MNGWLGSYGACGALAHFNKLGLWVRRKVSRTRVPHLLEGSLRGTSHRLQVIAVDPETWRSRSFSLARFTQVATSCSTPLILTIKLRLTLSLALNLSRWRRILVGYLVAHTPSLVTQRTIFSAMQVNVTLKKAGTKLEHQGIKIEFIGQIGELLCEKITWIGNTGSEVQSVGMEKAETEAHICAPNDIPGQAVRNYHVSPTWSFHVQNCTTTGGTTTSSRRW